MSALTAGRPDLRKGFEDADVAVQGVIDFFGPKLLPKNDEASPAAYVKEDGTLPIPPTPWFGTIGAVDGLVSADENVDFYKKLSTEPRPEGSVVPCFALLP